MTGYGRGRTEQQGRRAVVEIRSVNHRYLDIKLRSSNIDAGIEEKVVATLRKRLERGAVTVSLRSDSSTAAAGSTIDVDAAQRVHGELVELARALGLADTVSLELICAQPGVMVPRDASSADEVMGECILAATAEAIAAMIAMRATEGATLARDFELRITHLEELTARVSELAAQAPQDAHRRLEERLERFLANSKTEVEPARLAQEVAILADRHDVTEELVRLSSHFEQVRSVIAANEAVVGRRLGFLVQEIGRELNTIASKSQSSEITAAIVEGKAELEKMREQVQNIE